MKSAMILAAGRGERLRPLTDKIPKPMCLVQQKPLIEHHVAKLAKSGFDRIVINHAYLGSQIRQHLGHGEKWGVEICYAPEPPGGLETGGGIYNALDLLGHKPFLTVNADVFTDYEFSSLPLNQNAEVHLVLVGTPQHKAEGDFDLNEKAELCHLRKRYTYSGIACYRPEVFQNYRAGRYSIVSLFHELIKEKRISGELYQGFWVDIGSPEGLSFANQKIGLIP